MTELHRAEFPRFVVREVGYAPGGRMGRHAHDYSNVTAVISGEMEERTETGEHRGRSCSVLVKPAGTLHENRWLGRRGTRTVSIELRDTRLDAWRWLEDAETARAALALAAAMRGCSRDAVESCANALLALATNIPGDGVAPPVWLEDVKRVLDARYDEPLRFEVLAAEAGVHPVYLSRAFRRHVGMTMSEYVRELRLRHARYVLSATARPLASISAEAGFADASHLCRVFAGAHGLTASAFRRMTG